MNLRAVAAKIICRVVDNGLILDAALAEYLPAVERLDDRGFVKELCFGTLRWFDQLEFMLEQLPGQTPETTGQRYQDAYPGRSLSTAPPRYTCPCGDLGNRKRDGWNWARSGQSRW